MMTNRFSVFFLFATFAIATNSFAQKKYEEIQEIKREFQSINIDSSFTKVSLENDAFLPDTIDGGGMMTGYFKDGQIKKIYLWVGFSYGTEIKEYYFSNGQLIFVYEKFNSFPYNQKKNEIDLAKTVTTFEGRYYFNNNKLISHVTTGHRRFEDDPDDPAKTFLSESYEYLKLLREKK